MREIYSLTVSVFQTEEDEAGETSGIEVKVKISDLDACTRTMMNAFRGAIQGWTLGSGVGKMLTDMLHQEKHVEGADFEEDAHPTPPPSPRPMLDLEDLPPVEAEFTNADTLGGRMDPGSF